jgi:adenylate kinase
MAAGVRLVVLGKQGAGKGTQCVRLSHRYAVPHISTGDMLRAAVRSRSPLGEQVKALMDTGELLPDELVVGVVAERLNERDTRTRGFLLDGFPRTVMQAQMLDETLGDKQLDCVIDLDVPTELVMNRLVTRRVCEDCGAIYSLSQPPIQGWVCDICGGAVSQRPDDTADAIMVRLQAYEKETRPLIDFYADRGILETIDGSKDPDTVFALTVEVIKRRKASKA